jgi:hypothetical protein
MALLDLSLTSCVRKKVFGQIRTVKLRNRARKQQSGDFAPSQIVRLQQSSTTPDRFHREPTAVTIGLIMKLA